MTESFFSTVSTQEMSESLNVNKDFILELVQYSIVVPATGSSVNEWQFDLSAVNIVKKAVRLHRDLSIDLADLALVLNLLEEIEVLREDNARLKQRLNRFLVDRIG